MKLTNFEISNFLKDIKQNSLTEIVTSGKEKTELLERAKKRGILAQDSTDLGLLKTIFLFTDKPNANGAVVPSDEFADIFSQLIGKPMNIGHQRTYIVGHYIDVEYKKDEKKAIAYAVFYKNIFDKLWDKAQKFIKAKKLSSSFEIWSPKEKRVQLDKFNYELHEMEMAGGALIFEENGDLPAFKDAKVLNLAKTYFEESGVELVCAAKYKEEDLITSNDKIVKCLNCQNDVCFIPDMEESNMRCPKCFAIINETGVVIREPLKIDFNLKCVSCGSYKNFGVIENSEEEAKIKCIACGKHYNVKFHKEKKPLFDFPLEQALVVLSSISYSCPQCSAHLGSKNVRNISPEKLDFKCKGCGLLFSKEIRKMQIKSVKELIELNESSVNTGGIEMVVPNILTEEVEPIQATEEKVEEQKSQEVKIEEAQEEKVEEVKEEVVKAEKETIYKSGIKKVADLLIKAKEITKTTEHKLEKASKLKVRAIKKLIEKSKDLKTIKLELAERDKQIQIIKDEVESRISFYKENAKRVVELRNELGEYISDLKDEDLVNEDKIEIARLKKQLAEKETEKINTGHIEKSSNTANDVINHYAYKTKKKK